jgi:hypothetical protein
MFKIIELVECFKIYVMNTILIHVQVSVMLACQNWPNFDCSFEAIQTDSRQGGFILALTRHGCGIAMML